MWVSIIRNQSCKENDELFLNETKVPCSESDRGSVDDGRQFLSLLDPIYSSRLHALKCWLHQPKKMCVCVGDWVCVYACVHARSPHMCASFAVHLCALAADVWEFRFPPPMAARCGGNKKRRRIFFVRLVWLPQKSNSFCFFITRPLFIPTTTNSRLLLLRCWLLVTMQPCFHGNSKS